MFSHFLYLLASWLQFQFVQNCVSAKFSDLYFLCCIIGSSFFTSGFVVLAWFHISAIVIFIPWLGTPSSVLLALWLHQILFQTVSLHIPHIFELHFPICILCWISIKVLHSVSLSLIGTMFIGNKFPHFDVLNILFSSLLSFSLS